MFVKECVSKLERWPNGVKRTIDVEMKKGSKNSVVKSCLFE